MILKIADGDYWHFHGGFSSISVNRTVKYREFSGTDERGDGYLTGPRFSNKEDFKEREALCAPDFHYIEKNCVKNAGNGPVGDCTWVTASLKEGGFVEFAFDSKAYLLNDEGVTIERL